MASRTDRAALFEALGRLTQAQCESIATEIGMPRERWARPTAPQTDRAHAILRWAERQPGGTDALRRVLDEITGAAAAPDAGAWDKLRALPGRFVRGVKQRGFETRWAERVRATCGAATAPGLVTPGGEAVPLRDLYVERRFIALAT